MTAVLGATGVVFVHPLLRLWGPRGVVGAGSAETHRLRFEAESRTSRRGGVLGPSSGWVVLSLSRSSSSSTSAPSSMSSCRLLSTGSKRMRTAPNQSHRCFPLQVVEHSRRRRRRGHVNFIRPTGVLCHCSTLRRCYWGHTPNTTYPMSVKTHGRISDRPGRGRVVRTWAFMR